MWTLDYMRDLESDFSAIHRIHIDIDNDEWGGLTGPRFFRLAYRLAAYQGTIRSHQEREAERQDRMHEGATVIPLTREMVAGTAGPAAKPEMDVLSTLIDFG